MQVELNPDGTRNTQYRPRILLEDTTFNSVLITPHESYNYGLYDRDGVQPYQSWVGHVSEYTSKLAQDAQSGNVMGTAHPAAPRFQNPLYNNHASGVSRSGASHLYRRLHST